MHKKLARAGFEEKTFHTGEVRLNYVVGPDTGPPLLLIHGQSVTWEEYTFLMPLLADRFQVYAVTLRGHGPSTWTPGQYTFNNLGRDLTAFLRSVVGRPAVVAGNSSGGVLAVWLGANAPEWVSALVLEDPPLFRAEKANLKTTAVYDTWQAFSRAAVPGGGGFAYFLSEHVLPNMRAAPVLNARVPPKLVGRFVTRRIARKQATSPGQPIDFWFLPASRRIMMRGTSQFDGHFSRAFLDGSMGEGFDHAETLSRIAQPVLFLHANFHYRDGRLVGALDDDDVRRVESLVTGPWEYLRMDCGHVIALDAPDAEAEAIKTWHSEIASSAG